MIRNYQKHLNRLHVLMDALIIIAAYVFAWGIKFNSLLFKQDAGMLGIKMYMSALVIIVPSYLILYYNFNLYTPKRMQSSNYEMINIIKANTFGLVIFILALYLLHQDDFSRVMMFIFYVLNVSFEYVARKFLRHFLRKMRKNGFNQKHILLVGYSRAAESFIDRIKVNPQLGYHIYGILDDKVDIGTKYRGEHVIGRLSELDSILKNENLDETIITLGIKEYASLEQVVFLCEKSGVHTKFIPDYNNIIPTRPYTEELEGLPIINIRRVPLNNLINRFIKRTFDLLFAIIALIIFSPVMLITAILVKCTSKGPIIYKQARVGLHSEEFMMYKFRSMETQAPSQEKTMWTTCNDPRITKVGKIIRKTSIDELPQIINVIKGDMSLVGPRPERPYYVEKFKEEIPRYMIKHQVRPGMTGWAQVNGLRGDTSITKRIEFDLYYIENWSMGFDIKIMFYTLFTGFVNKNAY